VLLVMIVQFDTATTSCYTPQLRPHASQSFLRRDVSIRYCGNIAGLALVTLVNVRVLLLHYAINVYAAASAVLR
jgi:hypothetical protein